VLDGHCGPSPTPEKRLSLRVYGPRNFMKIASASGKGAYDIKRETLCQVYNPALSPLISVRLAAAAALSK
jgi:hypothetical protein